MARLTCVVIKVGSAISIVIDEGLPVYELKKAIKAEKPNDLKDVDADRLHLFLAKDDGDAWLGASSEVARQLQNGEMPDAIKTLVQKDKELLGGSDIKFMWQGMNPPANDQIHVLVKLPEKFTPNKRPRWTTGREAYEPEISTLDDVPQVDIKTAKKFVKLPAALLRACGLFSDHDLMLYRRSEVNDLWTYLQTKVVRDNKKPYIVGPPGTGKSACMLGFAASLDRAKWSVIWIHLAEESSCLVMRTKEVWEFTDLTGFLLPRDADEKLFVFVDGYKSCDAHERFVPSLRSRLHKTEDRFVVCSSMAALGKRNAEDDARKGYEPYYMYSWTQEEYLEAIADDVFYKAVSDKLDAPSVYDEVNAEDGDNEETTSDSDEETKAGSSNSHDGSGDEEESKKDRDVKLKFYYAGGSCRFMFQYTTDAVKSTLQRALSRASDTADLVKYCTGGFHSDSINTLYGMHCRDVVGRRSPVSSFAAYLMADDCDEKVIAQLVSRFNASVGGWAPL